MQAKLQHSQDGLGIVGMIIGLGALIGLGYLVVTRVYSTEATQTIETTTEFVNDTKETVEKANEAREKVQGIIDLSD